MDIKTKHKFIFLSKGQMLVHSLVVVLGITFLVTKGDTLGWYIIAIGLVFLILNWLALHLLKKTATTADFRIAGEVLKQDYYKGP